MYDDGYTKIVSTYPLPFIQDLDYSPIIIEKMRLRVPELDWRVMDIRELEQHADELGGAGSWDVIIDKGMPSTAYHRHDGCTYGREWVCMESK